MSWPILCLFQTAQETSKSIWLLPALKDLITMCNCWTKCKISFWPYCCTTLVFCFRFFSVYLAPRLCFYYCSFHTQLLQLPLKLKIHRRCSTNGFLVTALESFAFLLNTPGLICVLLLSQIPTRGLRQQYIIQWSSSLQHKPLVPIQANNGISSHTNISMSIYQSSPSPSSHHSVYLFPPLIISSMRTVTTAQCCTHTTFCL